MKFSSSTTAVITAFAFSAAFLAACTIGPTATSSSAAVILNDSELALPADYKTWPKFLTAVQRPDAKQVRDIYMNPIAKNGGTAAKGFPNGSVFVMENYAAAENADGTLKLGADGKLVKGALVAVFVQGKNPGWGDKANPALKNGDWIYSAYTATGAKHAQDTNTCRACHLPLVKQDFVHRYDEFFGTQKISPANQIKREQVLAALSNKDRVSASETSQLRVMSH